MKRRWLAALLALLMVMGTIGIVAAEEVDADDEKLEGQGPPQHIREMLEMKTELKGDDNDDDDDEWQGPPEFVRLMLKQKFSVMNKNKLMIHGNPFVSDLPPVIKHGRTLIPVNAVVKGLGAQVFWDEENEIVTITKGDIEIELRIGDNKYYVYKNDVKHELEMDVAAEILGNRTFVPLRFIAEALGEEIEYDEETKMIYVGRSFGQERAAEARMNRDDADDDDDEEEEEDED